MGTKMEVIINSKKHGTKVLIIDSEDFNKLENRSVYLSAAGYAKIKLNGKAKHVHRLIMGVDDPKIIVDHINRNVLDCRKDNLRLADDTTSSFNRGKRNGGKLSSKYKGVSKVSPRVNASKPFLARIQISKEKRISLGYYFDEREAAMAYNKAAIYYFGEFAVLNELENL